MNRMDLLVHGLDCTYAKEDWYPPLKDALAGLTAAQASWRPPGEAGNTIWENVSHLLFYKERLLQRLQNQDEVTADSNDDTFTPSGGPEDEAAWQADVKRMETVHHQLRSLLETFDEDAFDRPSPIKTLGLSVWSIILHDAFHTGQIVQIRKLQGSWPARRSFD
ncbi:DinB family protein [Brevibacillus ruminantium]|uniref:DinB family protein n=1 Tax=Brevibacillus ruminantium TaxID=2950604 RepID=A0ABY4WD31_9BACL|nr:DinB family protein [Brevibacillus ruminantium]USG64664.1 DinB family protein [Brevibacillus ruminantium]